MLQQVKAYNNTSVNWAKSQAHIMKLLEDRGIEDIRFTSLSYNTMARAGFEMMEDTYAIVLEFFKTTEVADGVGGKIPIKIIIPNLSKDERKKNQAYRIFFWYLKTKFEAVDTGLVEFEQEFMPHIALGKGNPLGNMWQAFKANILPQIQSGESADINLIEPPKKK